MPLAKRSAIFIASLFTFITLFASTTAHAQFVWPPQCSPIGVKNASSCTVDLCLKTNGQALCLLGIAPSTGGQITVPPLTLFGGVIGAANISYPFVATGFGTYVVTAVTLPPNGCCCDVTYDPATCSMRITNSFVVPCNP